MSLRVVLTVLAVVSVAQSEQDAADSLEPGYACPAATLEDVPLQGNALFQVKDALNRLEFQNEFSQQNGDEEDSIESEEGFPEEANKRGGSVEHNRNDDKQMPSFQETASYSEVTRPSRRRCPRTKSNCAQNKERRCHVMIHSGSLMQAKRGCSAFSATCAGISFCGLEKSHVEKLAAGPDRKSLLKECFSTVWTSLGFDPPGGYKGKIPAWYKYKDWKNIHKCIDQEMKAEKQFCEKYASDELQKTRMLFMDKMHICAQNHGVGNFDELSNKCNDDIGTLAKMEKCREVVTKEFMALRSKD